MARARCCFDIRRVMRAMVRTYQFTMGRAYYKCTLRFSSTSNVTDTRFVAKRTALGTTTSCVVGDSVRTTGTGVSIGSWPQQPVSRVISRRDKTRAARPRCRRRRENDHPCDRNLFPESSGSRPAREDYSVFNQVGGSKGLVANSEEGSRTRVCSSLRRP